MGSQTNLAASHRAPTYAQAAAGPSTQTQAQISAREARAAYRHEGQVPHHHDERSDAEKMTKRERDENRLPRLTAYATAEGYRLKMLQAFLKREHGVGIIRVFDDCIYAVSSNGHV